MTLNERRAEFVYNAARLAAIAAEAPIVPALWDEREQDFRSQFLQVIERQCGSRRFLFPDEVHNSWLEAYIANGWVYGEAYDPVKRTHPDLVRFYELEKREQDKDRVFIALCDIARIWIR